MRITFALPGIAAMGGGLRVVAQYAAHLEAQGHVVTLAIRRPEPLLGRRQKLLTMIGLRKRYAPMPMGRGYFSNLKAQAVYLDENRALNVSHLPDADIIISTWWTTSEWAERLPAAKGRHIHFVQGDEDFRPALSHKVQAVYRQPSPKIVVAGWLQDMFHQRYGQETTLAMNGVDTGFFTARPREKARVPRVGFLWSSHPHKNSTLALDTMIRLRMLHPHVQAIMFGGEPRPDVLPDWISYEQQPEQTRIPEIYGSCDLWLFTTNREGYGLPLLEAMACRTPVVATPAGAAPDLIMDGVNGRLLPPNVTAEEFAAAVDALLVQDAAAWRAMSDSAWQTAQQHGLDKAARAFEAAIMQSVHS